MEKEVSGMREVGGLVGGRTVGRLEGEVDFPKKNWGQGVGPKKTVARRKKM